MSFSIYSQDTLFVKGYYINRFEKKEIQLKKRNEDLKAESHVIMIDYKMQSFFFSLNINSNIILMNEDEIEYVLCSNVNYKNIEIYKFPPFNECINNYLVNENINNIGNIEFVKDNDYYIHEKDSVYIYKIYKIEGSALRVKFDNDFQNKKKHINLAVEWNIAPTTINNNIPSFYVYFFYNYRIFNPLLPLKGFVKWMPD
jgi:hypothetical protein